ncbi:MAG: aminotransferase class I/II-fold pyridoxal phosphate-dependent enzyme [Candidatus Falkowbacteria bacterium]
MKKQSFKLDLNENVADIYYPSLLKLQKRLSDVQFYARANDEITVKRVIAKYNKISAENIVLTNGSYHALELLSGFLLDKNDEMIILAPTFPFYDKFEKYKKFKIKKVFYRAATIAIDEIIGAITNKTKIVYIANPNNPIGSSLSRRELLKLIKICEKKKIFALIDEAYCEFGGESVVDLVDKYKYLIVLRTFSKFLGLAGIKVGYIVVNSARAQEFEFVRGPSFAISKFGLIVAETILRNPKLIKKIQKRNRCD